MSRGSFWNNSIKKWSDVTSPLILNDNNICLIAFLAALAALYEADADFPESGVWWRADFQSGFRVLKKVFWTLSYLYLWHTMWFHTKRRPAADSILMPPPFHSLNRYTPKFSGRPQKLTCCQQFGLQIFPKWGDADIFRLEMAVFKCFFGRNKFSRQNGRLSPIACLTDSESYWSRG